jgi:hypothetical protein
MAAVLFTFRGDVPEERQDAILEQVRGWPGVRLAARLKPDAARASLRRFSYADVADEEAAPRVVEMLKALKEIETAEIPPRRTIATP